MLLPAWKITKTNCNTSRNKLNTNLTAKHSSFPAANKIPKIKDKIFCKTAISVSSLIVIKVVKLGELYISL